MADYDEFKKKAVDVAEKVIDKTVDIAQAAVGKTVDFAKVAADKTKILARITKLKAENVSDNEAKKKKLAELGKVYYEQYPNVPEVDMQAVVEEIRAIDSRIAERKAEINALKNQMPPEDAAEVDEDDNSEEDSAGQEKGEE